MQLPGYRRASSGCSLPKAAPAETDRTPRTCLRSVPPFCSARSAEGELTRAKTHVRRLIDCRSNAEAIWAKLITSLEQVKAEALAEVRQMDTSVHFRWKLAAERDIVTTCQEAQAEDVILTMVALGYMASLDGRRFQTDTAWFMTAGRRFVTSPLVAAQEVSPAKRRLPASRNYFDQL